MRVAPPVNATTAMAFCGEDAPLQSPDILSSTIALAAIPTPTPAPTIHQENGSQEEADITSEEKQEKSPARIPILDTEEERYEFIFGMPRKLYKIKDPPKGYESSSKARAHMEKIKVPVWKYASKTKRVPSMMSLTVNKKLVENVQAIFQEIFELNERFCVQKLSGFQYRKMNIPWAAESSKYLSHHSFGTAIDINHDYNLYYHRTDKRNTKSPYYISENVVAVFEKYGWSWGGNFEIGMDTMHFQYLGLTCME